MLYRIVVGAAALPAITLAICVMANGSSMAAGAVALGEPSDISKDGVAIFAQVGAANANRAKERALAGCKGLQHASETSKALCKIVVTFENQCVAEAFDPEDGTPGFGWAMAPNSQQATEQALSNCRDTAGPERQDKCVVGPRNLWCDGSAR